MKEFKEIIDGVAHSLNMTVDSLVKAYPQLRTEYGWYYSFTTLQIIFGVVLAVSLIGSVISFISWHWASTEAYSSDILCKRSFKVFATVLTIAIIAFILFLVASVMKGLTSPDVLIINKVINTINYGK